MPVWTQELMQKSENDICNYDDRKKPGRFSKFA